MFVIEVHVEYNTPSTSREECAFDFNITAELVNPYTYIYGDEKDVLISVCVR